MKELQNNFTTPEQSKRLLKLGVPADSADFYWIREDSIDPTIIPEGSVFSEWEEVHKQIDHGLCKTIPCWSVGRLIEIYDITINLFPGMDLRLSEMTVGKHNESYIEKLVYLFECAAKDGLIDFEELEEEK